MYYLIVIPQGCEPGLEGPYDHHEYQVRATELIQTEMDLEYDGLYLLTIDAEGKPALEGFSMDFVETALAELEDEDDLSDDG